MRNALKKEPDQLIIGWILAKNIYELKQLNNPNYCNIGLLNTVLILINTRDFQTLTIKALISYYTEI